MNPFQTYQSFKNGHARSSGSITNHGSAELAERLDSGFCRAAMGCLGGLRGANEALLRRQYAAILRLI